MKLELTVPEVVDLIKQIQEQPGNLFEMIRVNVKETVGQYLSDAPPFHNGRLGVIHIKEMSYWIRWEEMAWERALRVGL